MSNGHINVMLCLRLQVPKVFLPHKLKPKELPFIPQKKTSTNKQNFEKLKK